MKPKTFHQMERKTKALLDRDILFYDFLFAFTSWSLVKMKWLLNSLFEVYFDMQMRMNCNWNRIGLNG